jgi:hypothetical protein
MFVTFQVDFTAVNDHLCLHKKIWIMQILRMDVTLHLYSALVCVSFLDRLQAKNTVAFSISTTHTTIELNMFQEGLWTLWNGIFYFLFLHYCKLISLRFIENAEDFNYTSWIFLTEGFSQKRHVQN